MKYAEVREAMKVFKFHSINEREKTFSVQFKQYFIDAIYKLDEKTFYVNIKKDSKGIEIEFLDVLFGYGLVDHYILNSEGTIKEIKLYTHLF
jgi:hypothetical protein